MYRIDTETGKILDGQRDNFFAELKKIKEKGLSFCEIKIVQQDKEKDRLQRFFFVLVEHVLLQDKYPNDPTTEEKNGMTALLKNEFLPRETTELPKPFKEEYKTIKYQPSMSNMSFNAMKEFVDRIVNWMTGNGYEVPDSEEYWKYAEENGKGSANEHFKKRLLATLKAKLD